MPLLVINRSQTEPPSPAVTPHGRRSPTASSTASLAGLPCRGRSPSVLPLEAVARLEQSPSVTASRRNNFHLVSMATARIKSHFHAPHGHRLFRSNSAQVFSQLPVDEVQRQQERDFICCYDCDGAASLAKSQSVGGSPPNGRCREVGCASKNLRVGDFQLLKTIGTGRHLTPFLPSLMAGTFARVWLACLADSPQNESKVFALKILRKTDGKQDCPKKRLLIVSDPFKAGRAYQERAKHVGGRSRTPVHHHDDYELLRSRLSLHAGKSMAE